MGTGKSFAIAAVHYAWHARAQLIGFNNIRAHKSQPLWGTLLLISRRPTDTPAEMRKQMRVATSMRG